jgi:hypothetical protein
MAPETLRDIAQKFNLTLELDETVPPELWLDKLREELAAKRAELQETNPQYLARFALEKRCLELEEAVRVLSQEIRRLPQQQLLEKMRQAVENGDKDLYDSLLESGSGSLLPNEGDPDYRLLLEVKRLAAEKRWPRSTALPALNPIVTDQPPPAPTTPLTQVPKLVSPKIEAAAPILQQPALESPQLPAEIANPAPVTTQPAPPKPQAANPWVWLVPTAIVIALICVLFFRHSERTGQGGARSARPITLQGLLLLFDQAHQAANSVDRIRICREFMRQSGEFATAHPEQTDLWMRRAAAAMELDYADDGWAAGRQLMAATLKRGLDPQVQKVTAALERKGWLEPTKPRLDWRKWTPERVKAAAEDGDEEAQVRLGDCYFRGLLGLGQDYKKSAEWYRKAAEQGNFEAQNYLGTIYLNGLTGDTNYTEALVWFRRAANQGSAAALGNLGVMYERGWGVETNVTEAVGWYRKSVEAGNSNAVPSLTRLTRSNQGVAR